MAKKSKSRRGRPTPWDEAGIQHSVACRLVELRLQFPYVATYLSLEKIGRLIHKTKGQMLRWHRDFGFALQRKKKRAKHKPSRKTKIKSKRKTTRKRK